MRSTGWMLAMALAGCGRLGFPLLTAPPDGMPYASDAAVDATIDAPVDASDTSEAATDDASALICADPVADCDGIAVTGCEADLRTDPQNCGRCEITCEPGGGCENRICYRAGVVDRMTAFRGTVGNVSLALAGEGSAFVAMSFTGTLNAAGFSPVEAIGESDSAIARVDPDGSIVWIQHAGGAGRTIPTDIALSDDGVVWVGGYFTGSTSVGATPLDLTMGAQAGFLVGLAADTGEVLHAFSLGSPSHAVVLGVARRPGGGVVIAARFATEISAGATTVPTSGFQGLILAGYGASETPDWTLPVDIESGSIDALELVATTDRVAVAGQLVGTAHLGGTTIDGGGRAAVPFIAFLEANGTFLRASPFAFGGSPLVSAAADTVAFGAPRLLVGGIFEGAPTVDDVTIPMAGDADGFVVEYDPLTLRASTLRAVAGGAGSQSIDAVRVDGRGNLVMAGTSSAPGTLGAQSIDGYDWIASQAADGHVRWVRSTNADRSDVRVSALGVDGANAVHVAVQCAEPMTIFGSALYTPEGADLVLVRLVE